MKTTLTEYDHAFHLDMEAETAADAALLARLAMNTKARAVEVSAYASKNAFTGSVNMPKRADTIGGIARS